MFGCNCEGGCRHAERSVCVESVSSLRGDLFAILAIKFARSNLVDGNVQTWLFKLQSMPFRHQIAFRRPN